MSKGLWLFGAVVAVACGQDPADDHTAADDDAEEPEIVPSSVDEAFPNKLSQTGIYPRGLNVDRPAARALSYAPRAPLWSDGLDKQRLLILPEGETVDTSEEPWTFPPGTLLVKTFSDLNGPIETRILRPAEDEFEYEVYQWNEDRTEAELLDGRLNVSVEAETEGGTVPHTIPSRLTCRQCHESNASEVLGFDALQLWEAEFDGELSEVLSPPPSLRDPVEQDNATTRAVLDYFIGNCVHCHNGGVGLASSFDLRPDVAIENVIDQPTDSSATAPGIRVVPGSPADSILFQAVSGEGDGLDVKDMPPEGVDVRDEEAIALLRRWIERL